MEYVDFLIVNEVEGKELAACDKEEEIIPELRKKYPKMSFLLTLGKRGSMVYHKNRFIRCGAHHVPVVDTKDDASLIGINVSKADNMRILMEDGGISRIKYYREIDETMFPEKELSESTTDRKSVV